MNKIKILHCGDLHFDTPFSELPHSLAEIKKEELREIFSNIIDFGRKEKVNLIFIAGDLFDNLRVTKSTLDFIRKKFEEIKNIGVFIAAGNHDPFNKKSFYELIEWSENVHIFSDTFEAIEIEEFGTVVYGASFGTSYVKESMLKNFKSEEKHKNLIKLMILHGDVASSEGGNEYNPITIDDIEKCGVDYLALGHRHFFSGIKRAGNTYYAYSGCPEGRGFDETGDKGIILGEIGINYANLSFISVCKRRYFIEQVDVTDCKSYEEIKERILLSIKDNKKEENLYKIVLKGELTEDFIINLDVLQEKLKNYFYFFKMEDNTSLKIDFDELSREFSIKGIYARKLLKSIKEESNEETKKILTLALKLGIQSLSEGDVRLDEN
ncbi:exonuclease SbcCD subunit D [Clostridium polyendosporum]|uniref:Exonuclease SbcCD subunit D n=1 Tax=Clostridium polyendosporum TaxID=69208 RepID=A0A919RZ26_9CLOT|nr:DNA repair exonuclease [Clostridium polyendosporum]GIM29180.1 exonuclease SbcCD subunit D [Clostridium polyendosporum]